MTVRDLYDAALIEINKLEAPSMLLEDYNYFINKAIQQYINKAYNKYELNQQSTDDLRVLKTTAVLNVLTDENVPLIPKESNFYYCILPANYLHMLNCVIRFSRNSNNNSSSNKCETSNSTNGNTFDSLARKLTSDVYPSIISNAYFKPSYKVPYYTITKRVYDLDLNSKLDMVLDPCSNKHINVTQEKLLDDVLNPCVDSKEDLVLEIRCGNNSKYEPLKAYIDYIRTPKQIVLYEDDLEGEDTTQIMEFPDYVCYEIINEFVKLLLENASDPRLQTNYAINQTAGFDGLKE